MKLGSPESVVSKLAMSSPLILASVLALQDMINMSSTNTDIMAWFTPVPQVNTHGSLTLALKLILRSLSSTWSYSFWAIASARRDSFSAA